MRRRWMALVAVGAAVVFLGLYLCFAYFLDLPGQDLLTDISVVATPIPSNQKGVSQNQPIGALVGPVLILMGSATIIAGKIMSKS